ncbi:MAG: KH domain-containing protein [Actinomycetota bacterium]|nr:KH domain-containing protein [Actinomycetota bacterium]
MSDLFESPSFPEPELEEDDEDGLEDEASEVGAAPAEANRAAGGRARAVLEHVATSIVDEPDAVEISTERGRAGLVLSLHVAPSDMGRVIGKRGRVAQAMRTLVRAAAASEGTDATVDIVD